jgi:hypothetical protein
MLKPTAYINIRSLDMQHNNAHAGTDRLVQDMLKPTAYIKPLRPNDPYRGRTAQLTSKVAFYIFIQQIEVLNILNMVYTVRVFLFKMQFVS